ncbi:hypothetical protein [Sphingomonas sp.]|uniref:hypothetical protein n=1 Tax=Sphingomonas sp. TaxID=28214 RepID=UPI002DD68BB8|nr:hypothetical protein [Sphingomonas sp.]
MAPVSETVSADAVRRHGVPGTGEARVSGASRGARLVIGERRASSGDGRHFHERVDIWTLSAAAHVSKPARRLLKPLGVTVPFRSMALRPGRGGDRSVGSVWEAFVGWMEAEEKRWAKEGRGPGDGFFELYRRVRTNLYANSVPHPDVALRAYLAFFGKDGAHCHSMTALLGSQPLIAEARTRLDLMVGKGAHHYRRGLTGDLDDLLEILPPWARDRFRSHLAQVRHPATVLPTMASVGRLCALPDGPIRLRGALCLIAKAAEGNSLANQREWVRYHCRHANIMKLKSSTSMEDVTRSLDLYASGLLLPLDIEEPRVKTAAAWRIADTTARKLALLVLGDDAELLTCCLPALHHDADGYQNRLNVRIKELGKPRKGKRLEKVEPIVSALTLILAAMENRVAQLEGLLTALAEQMPTARQRMDAGLRVGFGWTGPVVRADGSLGVTDQTIDFELFSEGELLTIAHDRSYRLKDVKRRMPAGHGEGSAYGVQHDAGRWGKIHLVYRGTTPADPDGEAVEPLWVDLFRWDVLDWTDRHSEKVKLGRRERTARHGLPEYDSPKRGILIPSSQDHDIAMFARGDDPEAEDSLIVIPLVEFYHAMAYARIALSYGIRWGARIGEILQIRLGPDCFRSHKVDGEMQPYVALQPKGWSTHGKFGLDAQSAGAMKSAKLFTNTRFYLGSMDDKGEPTLPMVPFCQSDRGLPPARYLFQHDGKMVIPEELALYGTVLLIGVIDMTSHDGRYTFATAMGLEDASYQEIGVLLHHSPGSAMPKSYDLSAAIDAAAAAERFNAHVQATLVTLSLCG